MQTYASDISLHHMLRARFAVAVAALLAAAGCGGAMRIIPAGGYTLDLGAGHPLVGQIYAGKTGALVSRAALDAAVSDASYLVLGETHDNPDQHALQAQLLAVFLQAHPRASVAFEMLDEQDAPALARARTPEQVAEQVDWADSGWPDFALYEPVFRVALQAGAQLVAAHPSAAHVRASMYGVAGEEAHSLHIDTPLPEAQQQAQREEIRESHCGHANPAMTTAMQNAQVYKDAFMARALLSTHRPTALIAGRGHARKDRAVPYFLQRMQTASLSVAFIDVSDALLAASDYELGAFDFVVFTPRVSDVDPCEQFRKQLEKMRAPAAPVTE